jgi:hypothetical protein
MAEIGSPIGAGRRCVAWKALLLPVLAVLAYAPALRAGFVFDDHWLLQISQSLRDIWSGSKAPDYLPLTWTTFWAESRIWSMWPAGYHGANVLLHAVVALLLWRTLEKLGVRGAYLGAVVFAVHPVTVESVAWVSELKNTLSGVFFLAAVLAWVEFDAGARARWLVGSLTLFACALLSKSAVVMLPFVLLGISLVRHGRVTRRTVLALAPFFLLALAAGLVTVHLQRSAIGAVALPARDLVHRIGDSYWALGAYLCDAFVPVHLAFLPPERPPFASVTFWVCIVALSSLIVVLIAWRSRTRMAVAFALAYHAVMVAPVLGLIDLSWFRHAPRSNHLQYLPLMGPAALAGFALSAKWSARQGVRALAVVAAVLALGGTTFARATAFHDEHTLWQRAASDAPDSAIAHFKFAQQLLQEGNVPDARIEFAKMAETARSAVLAWRGRALLALYSGRPIEGVAEAFAANAEQPDPEFQLAFGRELVRSGHPTEALPILLELVQGSPAEGPYRYWAGAALSRLGRTSEALDVLAEGVRLDPNDTDLKGALETLRAHGAQESGARAAPAD